MLIALVGLFVGATAVPASADRPEVDTGSRVFEDIDVCTGELQTVTLEFTFVTHHHGNNVVTYWTGESSTSLGYYGTGSGKIVSNDNMERLQERFAWVSTNEETGHATTVEGAYTIEYGEPVPVEDFVYTCLTA
jgi:hypothetical protein